MKNLSIALVAACAITFTSCEKNELAVPAANAAHLQTTPQASTTNEFIAGTWLVKEFEVKGTPERALDRSMLTLEETGGVTLRIARGEEIDGSWVMDNTHGQITFSFPVPESHPVHQFNGTKWSFVKYNGGYLLEDKEFGAKRAVIYKKARKDETATLNVAG